MKRNLKKFIIPIIIFYVTVFVGTIAWFLYVTQDGWKAMLGGY